MKAKNTKIEKRSTPALGLRDARVLVTGGGGFLGKAIIKRLLTYTPHIRSLNRRYYADLDARTVDQIQGDIRDPAAVEQACQERDVVFHVAAKTDIWGVYQTFYDTNVAGTQHVLTSCRKHGIPYLIYTSSPSVVHHGKRDVEGIDESAPYPDQHQTHYLKTKAMAEQLVLQTCDSRLRAIVLRPHLIWGPGDTHFVPRIIARAKSLRQVGNGKNLVDTTYIDNAALAHILAAEKLVQNHRLSGRVYFISQGEPIYLWDMVNHILSAAGKSPVTKSIPRGLAYAIGGILEFIYTCFRIRSEPKMTRFLANELASHHWFDISAAKKDLGYAPEVSIAEGLKQLKEWMDSWN